MPSERALKVLKPPFMSFAQDGAGPHHIGSIVRTTSLDVMTGKGIVISTTSHPAPKMVDLPLVSLNPVIKKFHQRAWSLIVSQVLESTVLLV